MMLCHPDAKKFRDNFKSHKEELTKILYNLFNEKVFENKLALDIIWNKKLTTTAGRFHGKKKYVSIIIVKIISKRVWIFDIETFDTGR